MDPFRFLPVWAKACNDKDEAALAELRAVNPFQPGAEETLFVQVALPPGAAAHLNLDYEPARVLAARWNNARLAPYAFSFSELSGVCPAHPLVPLLRRTPPARRLWLQGSPDSRDATALRPLVLLTDPESVEGLWARIGSLGSLRCNTQASLGRLVCVWGGGGGGGACGMLVCQHMA